MNLLKYLSVIGVFALGGCFNLDQSPHESIAAKDAYAKVNDAQYWVNGMYVKLRTYVYGSYVLASEIQADMLNATNNYSGSYGNHHRWEVLKANNSDLSDIWVDSYKIISNINEALAGIPHISPRDEDEKTLLDHCLGELYLGRAYVYTRLVTAFGRTYDPSTAKSDLGVPLELVYDIKTKNQRATLEDTYAQILSDIAKAEALLATKPGEPGADTFTIDAVMALKARVLFYMGRWAEAQKVAAGLLERYPLVETAEGLREMWYEDSAEESITQLYVSAPSQLPFSYGIYTSTYDGEIRPYYIPTQWTVDKYSDEDYRKPIYLKSVTISDFSTEYPDIYIVNKYPGNPALDDGGRPNYAHAPKVFRVAEMYLIASEAAWYDGSHAQAQTYLNQLRQARGLQPVAASGLALLEEIKEERMRELAFEGFRLQDLRRWKEPVVRRTPQNLEALASGLPEAQFHKLNRSAEDYRMVWPIPSREVFNGHLVQNPGWSD